MNPSLLRVEPYLDRLRYQGPTAATVETLIALHRAHLLTVPFENLDIHAGAPIVLSVPRFHDKVVRRRRGGFCYELNGLFAWLLAELGFRVALHSARVVSSGSLSPEFDHLALSVDLGERWIADVGFGESSLDPLPMGPAHPGDEDGYSIVEEGGSWTMARRHQGVLVPQYVFSLVPRRLDEFAARCEFQQTSPESHFTRSTICSVATPSGRVTLSGRRLIVTSGGQKSERELLDDEEYRSVLRSRFGIELTDAEVARLHAPRR